MKPITSWETLLEVAHPLAVEKGWWDDMDRPIDEQCANFHAEISEAWEEYRSGRMETWYSLGGAAVVNVVRNADGCPGVISGGNDDFTAAKPEGFWVEIADLLVRLADTCGRYAIVPPGRPSRELKKEPAALVCSLHRSCTVLESLPKGPVSAVVANIVWDCENAARHNGVDLWPIVNEKVAYNRTRPHRHGGKRA